MQTENRNMQIDCSTIIAWELLVKDNNIFNVHDDACLLCNISPSKKKKVQVVLNAKIKIGRIVFF